MSAPELRMCIGIPAFDQAPAQWVIAIALRQADQAMKVIRQHYPAMNLKRVFPADITNRFTQLPDMPNQQVIAVAMMQYMGEKPAASKLSIAVVTNHRVLSLIS